MRAERLGSDSIAATFPGTSIFGRLKSMMRYRCLWPPPRKRTVMRPSWFLPPRSCLGSVRDLRGLVSVSSSKLWTVKNRRPGDVGLYFLSGIGVSDSLEELDHLLAFTQGHEGLLPVGPSPLEPSVALQLSPNACGAARAHLDSEELFDRPLDLRLVGARGDLEAQRAVVVLRRRRLLGDERSVDDVVHLHRESLSVSMAAASSDSRIFRAARTS